MKRFSLCIPAQLRERCIIKSLQKRWRHKRILCIGQDTFLAVERTGQSRVQNLSHLPPLVLPLHRSVCTDSPDDRPNTHLPVLPLFSPGLLPPPEESQDRRVRLSGQSRNRFYQLFPPCSLPVTTSSKSKKQREALRQSCAMLSALTSPVTVRTQPFSGIVCFLVAFLSSTT